MRIPVYSPTIMRSEMDAVLTCMVEERVGPGEISQKLIKTVLEFFGASGAVAFRSPAIALSYALRALDLPAGAGVILSALAPSWQYTEVKRQGFIPLITDVSSETAAMRLDEIKKAAESGGKALLLHETLGFLPNFESLAEIGLPIIEDIAQSAGGKYKSKLVGSFGVFSILGLEEKDILTAGGGGVLITCERRMASVLKNLYDQAPSTDIIPDINASLALVQLKQMEKNAEVRRIIYEAFVRALLRSPHKTLPAQDDVVNPVYSFPVMLNSGFNEVQRYVLRKNIETEQAFKDSIIAHLDSEQEKYINASSLLLRTILFPLYPRLGSKNSAEIVKILAALP